MSGLLSKPAYVLAFADAFAIVAAVLAVSALLVMILPSLRPAKSSDAQTAATPALLKTANETAGQR